MSTTFLPQARGPDHDGARCEQASSAGSALTCGIHSHGQTAFAILGGELDIATAPSLAQRLAPLADIGKHLFLDLAGLRFCDCAGLTAFCAYGSESCRLAARCTLQRLLPRYAGYSC